MVCSRYSHRCFLAWMEYVFETKEDKFKHLNAELFCQGKVEELACAHTSLYTRSHAWLCTCLPTCLYTCLYTCLRTCLCTCLGKIEERMFLRWRFHVHKAQEKRVQLQHAMIMLQEVRLECVFRLWFVQTQYQAWLHVAEINCQYRRLQRVRTVFVFPRNCRCQRLWSLTARPQKKERKKEESGFS